MLKKQTKVEDLKEEEILDSLTDDELEQLAAELEADEDDDEEKTVSESSEEVDGTGGTEGNSKTNAMSIAMKKIAAMSPDQVSLFLASLDQIGHEADSIPDVAAQNQASIAMKGTPDSITDIQESLKKALKEDLATVFGDNKELTEEFKEKISTLFESAVSYRVSQIETQLTEAYDAAFQEEVNELRETLSEQIDSYISYIAEEWMKENEVAITNSLNYEIAQEFMEGIRNLFVEHNFVVPNEKQDLVDLLSNKVEELETENNKNLQDKIKLQESIRKMEREKLIDESASGLTVSQKEKLKQLVEETDYNGDDEAFKKKLDIIKESHFGSKDHKKTSTNIITEEIAHSPDEEALDGKKKQIITDPVMKNIATAVARTIK